MSLLQAIMQSDSSQIVEELSESLGLDKSQAGAVLGALLPKVGESVKENIGQSGSLLSVISEGKLEGYLKGESSIKGEEVVSEGNNILAEIFGSKDVSRQKAAEVAEETGVDIGVLKKALPVVASLVVGALSKNSRESGILGSLTERENSSSLLSFLDADKDGSVVDDALDLAKKLF